MAWNLHETHTYHMDTLRLNSGKHLEWHSNYAETSHVKNYYIYLQYYHKCEIDGMEST